MKISDNKLILKRRKKKLLRRWMLFMIFMLSVTIGICVRLKVFDVRYIVVKGQNFVSEGEIVRLSNVKIDSNIFYINSKVCEANVKNNPYILDVKIDKILPNTVDIEIHERTAKFYVSQDNVNYVIDAKGILLQKIGKVDLSKLIKLEGFNLTNSKLGEIIPGSDYRTLKVLQDIYALAGSNVSSYKMDNVDLSNLLNINVYYGKMLVKLGDYDNLTRKLNQALNIMEIKELIGAKGYIDVSFNNNPVIFVEK